MIHNNFTLDVVQFPHELITYGGNGSVFQNWAQYRLVMKYLCEMNDEQTLVMYSGHPLACFHQQDAPRWSSTTAWSSRTIRVWEEIMNE